MKGLVRSRWCLLVLWRDDRTHRLVLPAFNDGRCWFRWDVGRGKTEVVPGGCCRCSTPASVRLQSGGSGA